MTATIAIKSRDEKIVQGVSLESVAFISVFGTSKVADYETNEKK